MDDIDNHMDMIQGESLTPACEWCGRYQHHDTLPCAKKEIDRLRAELDDHQAATQVAVVDPLKAEVDRLLAELAAELAEHTAIANRPLDADLNVLLNRCENREPLSLADQHELYGRWQERGTTIGDYDEKIVELQAIVAKLPEEERGE